MNDDEYAHIIQSAQWRIDMTNKQLNDPNFSLMWGWPLEHGLPQHHQRTRPDQPGNLELKIYEAVGVDPSGSDMEIALAFAQKLGLAGDECDEVIGQRLIDYLDKIGADPSLVKELEDEFAEDVASWGSADGLGKNPTASEIEAAFAKLDAQKESYDTEDLVVRDTLRKNVIYPARVMFDPYVFRIYNDDETPLELVTEVLEFLLPNLSDTQVAKIITTIEAEGSVALCSSGYNLALWKELVISLVEAGMDCSLEIRPAKESA